jgi:hypothetical protein
MGMKKQITIDGENSDWYEKAIFILKDKKEPPIPNNLFLYAEYIIENHLKKNPAPHYYRVPEKKAEHQKKSSHTARMVDRFFDISLIICGISIIALIVLLYI